MAAYTKFQSLDKESPTYEVELGMEALKQGYTMVKPKEALEIEVRRRPLCLPEVFQPLGHTVIILTNGSVVESTDGSELSELTKKSVAYYWTEKADTADQFWTRQDEYRFAKYGKVWRISDKEAEKELTESYRAAAADEKPEVEARPFIDFAQIK